MTEQPPPDPALEAIQDAPTRAPVPWRAAAGIPVFVLAVFAAGVGGLIYPPVDGKIPDRALVLGMYLNEIALFVGSYAWARFVHQVGAASLGLVSPGPGGIARGLKTGLLGTLAAYAVGVVQMLIVTLVTGRQVEPPSQIELQATTPSAAMIVALGFAVVVLAPLGEEVFFRGFVHRALRTWARPAVAVVLSSLVFAVVHVQPLVILPIFVLGTLLARLVEERDSVVPAIAAHMLFNAIGFTLLVTTQLT